MSGSSFQSDEHTDYIRGRISNLEAENVRLHGELAVLENQLRQREKCSAFVMRDCPTHGESSTLTAFRGELAQMREALEGMIGMETCVHVLTRAEHESFMRVAREALSSTTSTAEWLSRDRTS